MRTFYLLLTIIGFILPNIFVYQEGISSGNWLLWVQPANTITAMFINTISTAFVVDLLFVVLVFFIWTYHESKRLKMKNVWIIWVLTLLFGMAGTFPLFLYLRRIKLPFV